MLFLYNLIVFHIPTLLAMLLLPPHFLVAIIITIHNKKCYKWRMNTWKTAFCVLYIFILPLSLSLSLSLAHSFPIVLYFWCFCVHSHFMDDGGKSSVLQSYKLATKLPQTFIIISFYCICEILFYLILFSFLLPLRRCHLQPK